MGNNRYILQIKDYFSKAIEALENNNVEEYGNFVKEADKMFQLYKEDAKLTYECTNFGMANHIFENALPKLFKSHSKVIREFINTIKGDKNLLAQFKFQVALKGISEGVDKRCYINDALELSKNNIDIKSLKESNEKLFKIIEKYDIKPSEMINENDLRLYESCDYLFKNNPKLSNLNKINENINVLLSSIENKSCVHEDKKDFSCMVQEFDEKYGKILNEDEKSLVKTILETKSSDSFDKKKELYDAYKNECIEKINSLYESASNEEKEGLTAIKEQLETQVFSEETLIKDLARLLEIRDVLNN